MPDSRRLPGAEFAGQQAAFGVPDSCGHDGGVLQAAALDVVMQPAWQTHLRGLRHQLQARRDLLVTRLREHAPQAHVAHVPRGGLNLWARLPDGTDPEQLTRDCGNAGVIIAPGTEWFPAEPTGPFIRPNYAGPNPSAFPEGARILGRSLELNGRLRCRG